MTALDLLIKLKRLSWGHHLHELQVVIRLEDSKEETHMGGLAGVTIESGCTDRPALVLDCDQDPIHCPIDRGEQEE